MDVNIFRVPFFILTYTFQGDPSHRDFNKQKYQKATNQMVDDYDYFSDDDSAETPSSSSLNGVSFERPMIITTTNHVFVLWYKGPHKKLVRKVSNSINNSFDLTNFQLGSQQYSPAETSNNL